MAEKLGKIDWTKVAITHIKVESKDGETVEMDVKILKKSPVLVEMVNNLELDLSNPDCIKEPICCNLAMTEALQKINEWIIVNHDKPAPSRYGQDDKRIVLKDEDTQFMNMNNNLLVNILNTANYYDIDDLVEIMTQKIADMIKDKTAAQLRKLFKLPDDLTADEVAEIRAKHEWAVNGRY